MQQVSSPVFNQNGRSQKKKKSEGERGVHGGGEGGRGRGREAGGRGRGRGRGRPEAGGERAQRRRGPNLSTEIHATLVDHVMNHGLKLREAGLRVQILADKQ